MKGYFTKKELIAILLIVFLVVSYTGYKLLSNLLLESRDTPLEIVNHNPPEEEGNKEDTPPREEEEVTIIMVHISGQVYQPGLVVLNSGSRVIDAVELAGGLKKEADIDKINLAKKLSDEEKIYIPAIDEEVDIGLIFDSSTSSGSSSISSSGRININTSSKEELMQLPGIGEVTATRIIDYRSKTPFRTIEDIMNVSGIGVKKFDAIKEMIKCN
ncbi:MAG: helix-hairpin-helix domain-containing protein [Tissierellaceae bacterium]|jgi:competence protein ComEA